jgi:hypothetical protein
MGATNGGREVPARPYTPTRLHPLLLADPAPPRSRYLAPSDFERGATPGGGWERQTAGGRSLPAPTPRPPSTPSQLPPFRFTR